MFPSNGAKIGLITAITVVSANMIGTGVFTSLGFQVGGIPEPFAIIMLWLLGGVTAMCGAFAYAEISTALPRSGGEYHLLGSIYHPSVGFASGWISLTAGFAAPVAAAAIAMGGYLDGIIAGGVPAAPVTGVEMRTAIAITVVTGVSLVHLLSLRTISRFQTFFTGLKILLIVALIGLGFLCGSGGRVSFAPNAASLQTMLSPPFAVSLVFVMYAYSGWNAATYIAGEIRDPARTIPWSLFLGTGIVIVLYVLINMVFLYTTPMASIEGRVEVGLISAQQFLGPTGGSVMAALIAIGLVSAISSMTWAGPRVTMVMGEDVSFLRVLATKSRNGIPVAGIVLQWALAVLLILTSSFEQVLVYLGFTLSLSTFMTVLGVFVLRFRQPDLPRPYRTWGFPVTPAFFLLVTGWMLVFLLRDRPVESLAGLGTVVLGLGVYALNSFFTKGITNDIAQTGMD